VISSYNRNFVGRHDGNPKTHSFVTSPELVAAFAFAGSLQYNPAKDTIPTQNGEAFSFSPPHAEELPSHFEDGTALYQAPPEDGESIDVQVSPTSDNLQLLAPFNPWHKGRAEDLSILIKVRGQYFQSHSDPPRNIKLTRPQRQMHHRPHLPRRPVVQIPRPPRKHLQQPAYRRRKRHSPQFQKDTPWRDS
jgi:aconitase A